MRKTKFIAALCAVLAAAAVFSGCKEKNGNADIVQNTGHVVSVTRPAAESGEEMSAYNAETRPLEEGDDYAINKLNTRSPEGALPGGYKLVAQSAEDQGKIYLNGKSRIVISAYNYKDDLQDIEVWAENACAMTKIKKMFDACDTEFKTPVKQTILGFDGIRYDYDFIQYKFVENPDDPEGEKLKSPIGNYKGIADFFCSTQDAYAITFETSVEDWDEQSKNYEAFLNDLEITPTVY